MIEDHDQDPLARHDADRADQPAPGGTGGSALRRGMLVVLSAVAVLAAGALVAALVLVRPDYDEVQDQEAAEAEVVRTAERFTALVNNYSVDSVDGYQESLEPLLTTKFQDSFEQAIADIVRTVTESEMSSEGEVLKSAVASIDPDSASVLVVADATAQTVFGTRLRHFRWEVSLVRVDREWLVDDFVQVG